MRSVSAVTAGLMLSFTVVLASGLHPAAAQTSSHAGDIPQSLRLEHDDTLSQLQNLAKRHGDVGVEARKALVLFKHHLTREEAFILPPLTLLPELAEGKVTPDMKWALPMTDRTKAEHEETFQEHTRITEAMNAIAAAARKAHDAEALAFAQAMAADSLNDVELTEPTTVLIGEYLKLKLGAQ